MYKIYASGSEEVIDNGIDSEYRNGFNLIFSSDSETETNFDYIDIYVKDSTGYRYRRLTGSIGGTVIFVPGSELYLYWYTDGSVTRNGWKIESVTKTQKSKDEAYSDYPNTAVSIPLGTYEEITGSTKPESDHPYTNSIDKHWHWTNVVADIYTVIYDDQSPDDSIKLVNPKLDLIENSAGTFSCKIPPTNPGYSCIERLTTEIIIYKKDNELWRGRVISESEDFWKNRTINCEGEMAYLNDTAQPLEDYENTTPYKFIEAVLKIHNDKVESKKEFQIGAITNKSQETIEELYTNYETTLKALNDKLVSTYGGYFQISKRNGIRYLDYVAEESRETCGQAITFGNNLLDFTKQYNATDFCTVLLPLGARLENAYGINMSGIDGVDARYTIEDCDGQNGSPYLVNEEGVAAFGWIEKVVTFDDCADEDDLMDAAKEYMNNIQYDELVLEVKAVDLSYLNFNTIDDISLSNKVRVISKPHGLDRYFPVTKISIPLDNPGNTTFTIGSSETKTLSSKYTSGNSYIQSQISNIPTSSDILLKARKNAALIIDSFTTGYITITQDDNGSQELYVSDVQYADAEDIKSKSSRYWRWNLDGLGYYNKSKSGYNNPDNLTMALTMDGAIVADFITAGTMTANIIKAGVFSDLYNKFYLNLQTGELRLTLTSGNTTLVDDNGNPLGKTFSDMVTTINANEAGIRTEVARAISAENSLSTVWTGSYIPTLNNLPASNWTTDALREVHLNDIFIIDSGYTQYDSDTGRYIDCGGDTYVFEHENATGINGVQLVFSSDSRTEGISTDYVRIYYYDTEAGNYRYTENLGGTGIANQAIFIPSPDIYIYWYTDSSVVYYGFSISAMNLLSYDYQYKNMNFPYTATSLPSATNTYTLNGMSTYPETTHNYSNGERKLWTWHTGLNISNGYVWRKHTDIKTVRSSIIQTADKIASTVTAVDTLKGKVDNIEDGNFTQKMQSQIEQTAESITMTVTSEYSANYSGDYVPTNNNYPANSWTTTEIKESHVNDTFVRDNGDLYVYDEEKGVNGVMFTFSSDSKLRSSTYEALDIVFRDVTTGTYKHLKSLLAGTSGIKNKSFFVPASSGEIDIYILIKKTTTSSNYNSYTVSVSSAYETTMSLTQYESNYGSKYVDYTEYYSVNNREYFYSLTSPPASGTLTRTSVNTTGLIWYSGISSKISGMGTFKWDLRTNVSSLETSVSQIKQTSDKISLAVTGTSDGSGDVNIANRLTSELNITKNKVEIKSAGAVSIQGDGAIVISGDNFSVDENGKLTAKEAQLYGRFATGTYEYVEITGEYVIGHQYGGVGKDAGDASWIEFNNVVSGMDRRVALRGGGVVFSCATVGIATDGNGYAKEGGEAVYNGRTGWFTDRNGNQMHFIAGLLVD